MGIDVIKENSETYARATEIMQKASSYQDYIDAAVTFESLGDYEDAQKYAANCRSQADIVRKSGYYHRARIEMSRGDEAGYSTALHYFKKIEGFKDADELALRCAEVLRTHNVKDLSDIDIYDRPSEPSKEENDIWDETQNKLSLMNQSIFEEQLSKPSRPVNRQSNVPRASLKRPEKPGNTVIPPKPHKSQKSKSSRIIVGSVFGALLIAGLVVVYLLVIKPMMSYDDAMALLEQGKYEEGYEMLVNIGREDVISQNKHERAQKAIEDKDYSLAVTLCTENNETDFLFGELMTLYDKFSDEKNYHDSYAIISSLNGSSAYDSMRFDKASQYITDSFDDKAFILLTGLTSDNAIKLRNSISNIPFELNFIDAGVGDIVEFGRYELDSNPDNGKETLKWRIADKQDGKYLLICQSVVDCLPFNSGGSNYTWDSCTLRKIMNMSYLPSMFTDAERKIICETNTVAESNPESHVASGVDCVSSIFILSASEYEKYIGLDNAGSIDYAGFPSVGAPLNIWLRNPGAEEGTVSYVTNNGTINYQGAQASTAFLVLPAVWVKSTTI